MVKEAGSVITDGVIHGAMKKIVLHINQRQIADDCNADSTVPVLQSIYEADQRKLKLFEAVIEEIGRRLQAAGFSVPKKPEHPPFKKVTPAVTFLFCDEAMTDFIVSSIKEKPIQGLMSFVVLDYDREFDQEWLKY